MSLKVYLYLMAKNILIFSDGTGQAGGLAKPSTVCFRDKVVFNYPRLAFRKLSLED